MTGLHNLFEGLFDDQPWPYIDTRPCYRHGQYYWPGYPKNQSYCDDMAQFSSLGLNRRTFIRLHSATVEFSPLGWDPEPAKLMPAWSVIVWIAPGSYFELPFWRGPMPYVVEPETDVEVAAIVADCVAAGGYHRPSLATWRKALEPSK